MTVAFPAVDFDANWRKVRPAQANRSQWTGATKIVGLAGAQRWQCDVQFEPATTEIEERVYRVFTGLLDGIIGITNVPLPCQTHVGAKPVVGSAPGTGQTLPLTGMTPSTTILYAGQRMTVPLPSGHARLVELTADLVADGSGNATADFWPELGQAPTVGATVETLLPYCPMRATGDAEIQTQNGVSTLAISFDEAL